jgi:hypothetical protein
LIKEASTTLFKINSMGNRKTMEFTNRHGYDYEDDELHFDIWRSMNGRFNQRQTDPRIDLLSLEAKWRLFQHTPWLQPLLTN